MNFVTATPAYGRDYTDLTEVKAAWAAGKDFRCWPQGPYINKQDADHYGVIVDVRYDKSTKAVRFEPGE